MLLSKECCILVLDPVWCSGLPSQKDKQIQKEKREKKTSKQMWQRNDQTHLMDCAWVSLVRGHYLTKEGYCRIYKIESTMEKRDLLFTVSHTSIGKHWTKSECAFKISRKIFFMLVLRSCVTHFHRMLWMPEFYPGLKMIRQKDKNKVRTTKCHWRLEERSKLCYFFPAVLWYCSLGGHLWATTRNRIVTEMNFSLITKKKKKNKKSFGKGYIQFLNEGGKAVVQLLAGLWQGILFTH